jgi:DivIVA domain-containing protein
VTTVLQYLVVAAVIGLVVFGIAVLVFGRGEQLAPLAPRVSPTELPDADITADDVSRVRFPLAVRGYRMSDVDWAMRRLGSEIDRLRADLDSTSGAAQGASKVELSSDRVFAVVTPDDATRTRPAPPADDVHPGGGR